ncbi:MAG: inositol monophosphatase [Candidatus Methylacidiphilales bacterium]|nr:inositol monophosphatase family protein [Candidatus Methylacidiphilales bacterium]
MIYTAIAAAHAAGELIRHNFGLDQIINENSAHDIKIQADVDAQALISSMILGRYPDHALIGEEGNAGNPDGHIQWIVDPIDGTVNYVMGIPHFCVSIAARERDTGKYLLGVIYDPMRDELFTAEHDSPTLLNGRPQTVSKRTSVSEALMAVGFAKSEESIEHCLSLYQYYGRKAKKLRAMGSAALDLAYVATGRLDAYIEQSVGLWDVAAGVILVEQAGGKAEVTVRPDTRIKIAATNGRIDFPLK